MGREVARQFSHARRKLVQIVEEFLDQQGTYPSQCTNFCRCQLASFSAPVTSRTLALVAPQPPPALRRNRTQNDNHKRKRKDDPTNHKGDEEGDVTCGLATME